MSMFMFLHAFCLCMGANVYSSIVVKQLIIASMPGALVKTLLFQSEWKQGLSTLLCDLVGCASFEESYNELSWLKGLCHLLYYICIVKC